MEIELKGIVSNGSDKFTKEILLPTNVPELANIDNWPDSLVQGTFNIKISTTEFPDLECFNLNELGVRRLDRSSNFLPIAYLDHSIIPKNTITPNMKGEYAGDLQFWKAILNFPNKNIIHNCYMLRRVKSGYAYDIEFVSNIHLKTEFDIVNDDNVFITLIGETLTKSSRGTP